MFKRQAESEPEPAVQQAEWENFMRQGGRLDVEDDFGESDVEFGNEGDDDEFGDLMRGLGKF